jgi:hypothetical protein
MRVWQVFKKKLGKFGESSKSQKNSKIVTLASASIFCQVLKFAKFACEWPFLKKNNRKCKKVISNKDITASQALVQGKSNIF